MTCFSVSKDMLHSLVSLLQEECRSPYTMTRLIFISRKKNKRRKQTKTRILGSPPSRSQLMPKQAPRCEKRRNRGQRTEQQARAAKAGLPECWNWAAEGRSSIHSRAPKGLGGWAEENAGAHVPKLFREKRSRKSERPKQRLAFSC